MSQYSSTNEIKGQGQNANEIQNDEIAKELRDINVKLGTIEEKIDRITPGTYTRSWRDYEK